MKLPSRMLRIADRMKLPESSRQFKWVEPSKI